MKDELCAAKDCGKEAYEDCGFFVLPRRYDGSKGIIFALCKSHSKYYKFLVALADDAITTAARYGMWNVDVPKFTEFIQEGEQEKK